MWHSRDDLVRERALSAATTVGLGVIACVAALFSPELAVASVLATMVAGFRSRKLFRLISRVDAGESADQTVESQTHAGLTDSMTNLAALVESLPAGAIREAAGEALRAAETATESRHRLVRRRGQLRHVHAVTQAPLARRRVDDALRACEKDLRDLDGVADELVASVADLVDSATDESVRAELTRVRDTAERMSAIAEGLRQVGRGQLGASPGRTESNA